MSACSKFNPHQWKKGACRDCFKHIELHDENALSSLSIAERIAQLDRSNRCDNCEQINPMVRKLDTSLLEKFSHKDEVLPLPVNGAQHTTTSAKKVTQNAVLSRTREWRSTSATNPYSPPDLCSMSSNARPSLSLRSSFNTSSGPDSTGDEQSAVSREQKGEIHLTGFAQAAPRSNRRSSIVTATPSNPTTPSTTSSTSLPSSNLRIVVETPNKWAILRARMSEKERNEPMFAYVSGECQIPLGTIVRIVDFFTPLVVEYLDSQGEMLRADCDPDVLTHVHPRQVYSGNVIKVFMPSNVLHLNVTEGDRYYVVSKPNAENNVFCVHSRSMTMGYAPYDIFYLRDFFGSPVKMAPYKPDYYSDFSSSEEEPEEELARMASIENNSEQDSTRDSSSFRDSTTRNSNIDEKTLEKAAAFKAASLNKKKYILAAARASRLSLADPSSNYNSVSDSVKR